MPERKRETASKRKINIAAALILTVFTFLSISFHWFANLNLILQDAVYQRENSVDSSIKIIAIDEKTLDALGQFETWTREPYAELIEILDGSGYAPRVIGFDILLVNEKSDEDQLLLDACAKYSNIVMAGNLVFSTKIETTDGVSRVNTLHIDMVEEPFGELADTVSMGFANTVQDSTDSAVRYTLLEVEEYQSFASAVVSMAQDGAEAESPADYMPADENGGIYIDYTAEPESYEILSLIDVLEGNIPAAAFEDSIVLVGAYAAGMGDSYPVPIADGAQMYGVEIQANIVQGLMEQRSLTYVSPYVNAFVCAVIVFLFTLLACAMPIWGSALTTVLIAAAQYALCLRLDGQGLVINMITLPLAVLAVLVWSIVGKYAAEALHKRKIMGAFQKYVAPQVVEEIAKNQDYQLKLGGEKRHIAVLFVDIRGFTPLSEALQPEEVVEILNEYLSLVTDAVFQNGGTLDKFIGDAAMAVFNAPFDTDDYIYRAVCAAGDIAAGSDRIAATFRERFGKTVSYGIGVNCGDAVVGNIGSEFRMDYTAIGDTVNTAARLEANAKAGQILISEFVYEPLKDRLKVTEVGEIPLKGKSQGVMVYSLDEICREGGNQ
ncbi:MAG: adenylate/guanylate cyclase domain-containing protein [Lachnospiraceae bacterium]|nr:adenylate/guanylate cyclase domain-containing protein [Lachnospiraceae bacterium]